jgi:uncharacterized protein (TIGR00304 family)
MNKYSVISLLLFIIGIIFIVISIIRGEVEAGFILIFPFLKGSDVYVTVGIILIFAAFVFYMFGFVRANSIDFTTPEDIEKQGYKEKTIKGGGIVLIGPIPIVFGSNWKIALLLMLLAIVIMVIFLITIYYF